MAKTIVFVKLNVRAFRAIGEALDLNAMDLLVLYTLCLFVDEAGDCFPSHLAIARAARVSVRTVARSIKRLAERKLIEVFHERKGALYNIHPGLAGFGRRAMGEFDPGKEREEWLQKCERVQKVKESSKGGIPLPDWVIVDRGFGPPTRGR
jgi:hypothetical protein